MNLVHLPTAMLAIGYPLFWAEMFFGTARNGITHAVGWWLFFSFVVFIVLREQRAIQDFCAQCRQSFLNERRSVQIAFILGFLIGFFVLTCVSLAALHPPHLMQESDVMNYHLTLPRQHLILGSFEHIPWSADDFFYLPVDFALAPFWFATELPNKYPQFIFFLGLLGVVFTLTRTINGGAVTAGFFCLFALLGSHGHGVQMGTAMLDLTMCYLFLAAVESFLKNQKWLFIIECSFFLWAKSLVALQVFVFLVLMVGIFWFLHKTGFFTVTLDFQRRVLPEEVCRYRQFFLAVFPWILMMSVVIAVPFMAKSVYYTGTPFFPVGVGSFDFHPGISESSPMWDSLLRSAEFLTTSIHRDGFGRSVIDFLVHFWALAVPSEKVNNAFDYPMGLSYLIFLGPFIFFFCRSLVRKEIPVLPLMVVVYWILWWFSVRETRHLYAPVLLMMIASITSLKDSSKVFVSVVLIAMLMNAVSVYRAHSSNFGRSPEDVLRAEDKALVKLSRQYLKDKRTDPVELEQFEVAFAQFPVIVRRENLPHVIAF